MGRRGPKPTPTAILEDRGSWRAKARRKAGEPKPPLVKSPPVPPDYLREHGRTEWNRVVVELIRLGVLADIELSALALHVCKPLDDYWEYDAAIRQHGLLIENAEGGMVRNPLLISRDRAWAQHRSGCASFGLTPADRPKLATGKASPESHTKPEPRQRKVSGGGILKIEDFRAG